MARTPTTKRQGSSTAGQKAGSRGASKARAKPVVATTWPAVVSQMFIFFGDYRGIILAFIFACLLFFGIVGGTSWYIGNISAHLSEITEKQAKNAEKVLDLHTKMLGQAEDTRATLENFTNDLIRRTNQLANAQRDVQAVKRAESQQRKKHTTEIKSVRAELGDARDKLEKTKDVEENLRDANKKLAAFQKERDDTVKFLKDLSLDKTQIASLPEKFRLLVLPSSDQTVSASAAVRSTDAESPFLVALNDFAKSPTDNAFRIALRKAILNSNDTQRREAIQNSSGFRVWFKAFGEVLGVVSVKNGLIKNILSISGETSPTSQSPLRSSVSFFDEAWLVQTVDPTNISRTKNYFTLLADGHASTMGLAPRPGDQQKSLRLSQVANFELLKAQNDDEPELNVYTLEDFLSQNSPMVREWYSNSTISRAKNIPEYFGIDGGIWFENRIKNFGRDNLKDASLGQLPRSAQSLLEKLLINAARKKWVNAEAFAADTVSKDDLVKLGTAALYPDFKILSVTLSQEIVGERMAKSGERVPILTINAEFGRDRRFKPVEKIILRLMEVKKEKWELASIKFPGSATESAAN